MRYSFHGKVRATGQTVDGFVEAPNSTAAIDRLADRGIIGVYSVRPAPKPPEEEKPALPPPPPPPPPKNDSEIVFTQLVDKLGTLLTQVEKLLDKPPQQVIYQNHTTMAPAPVREASSRVRRPHPNMASNATLRDIFQTNLDLRQSLEKLASNGGSSKALSETAKTVSDAANRLTQAAVEATSGKEAAAIRDSKKVEEEADAEHHAPTSARETGGREANGLGLKTAQPAA